MAYLLVAYPTSSSGTPPLLGYDGVTDSFFSSKGTATPNINGISVSYATSNVSSTKYTATLTFANSTGTKWVNVWNLCYPLDYGETVSSATGCTATVVGTWANLTGGSASLTVPAQGSTSVSVTWNTTGSNTSRALLITMNGVILRTANPSFLNTVTSAVPDNTNNTSKVALSSNLSLDCTKANSRVFVTVLNKSCIMKNTFGYFVYNTSCPPTSPCDVNVIVTFPYVELTSAGGALNQWNAMAIPFTCSYGSNGIATPTNYLWPAGYSVGFFLGADTWYISGNSYGFNTNKPVWYSCAAMNTGSEIHFVKINVTAETPNTTVVGVEDTALAASDKDYSDFLFSVRLG